MEKKKYGLLKQLLWTIGFGLASFFTQFFLNPKRGVADWVWMGLMLLIPGVLVWLLDRVIQLKLPWLLLAMAVQYVLLIALAELLANLYGIRLDKSCGWFEYIGAVFPWPVAVTAVQAAVLSCLRKFHK